MFSKSKNDSINEFNDIIFQIKKGPKLVIKYLHLDIKSMKLQVYSDAPYSTNMDETSQLWYFIFLVGSQNFCYPTYWISSRSKRSVRSILESEIVALAGAFDMAVTLKFNLKKVLGTGLLLRMINDSKSLFDVLTKATFITEKSQRKIYK